VSLNEPSALHISTRVCFVRVESLRTRHGTTVSAPVCDGDSWSYEHRGRTYTCTGLAQVTSLPWPAPPHTTQQPSVLPPLGFGRDPASPSHASEQRSRTTKSRDGYQRGPLGQYLQAVAAWWHALGMSHHHQSKRALPRVHCKAQRPPAHNAVATTGGDERVPLAARSTSQCSHRDGSWKKAGAAAHAWLACYARCDTPRRCHTRARPRTRPPARHRTRSLLLGWAGRTGRAVCHAASRRGVLAMASSSSRHYVAPTSRRASSQASDWAAKRRAAIEHAEALKAERKRDEELVRLQVRHSWSHSSHFTPQFVHMGFEPCDVSQHPWDDPCTCTTIAEHVIGLRVPHYRNIQLQASLRFQGDVAACSRRVWRCTCL
jgi:hypothetical protein